jgi:hypothetical protein
MMEFQSVHSFITIHHNDGTMDLSRSTFALNNVGLGFLRLRRQVNYTVRVIRNLNGPKSIREFR